MLEDLTRKLEAGEDLRDDEAKAAAGLLAAGALDEEAALGFLRALARKGESAAEIGAFATVFLDLAVDPEVREECMPGPVLDIVGTGGDRLNLFNVSTTAMFVLAGGGVCVLKHGNRAVTSASGGADVLEALGVRIDLPPGEFAGRAAEAGLGFLFAPLYHPAFKRVAPLRQRLAAEGVRTIFNLLGPLLNPVRPRRQLIGVAERRHGQVFAEQMRRAGRARAWVVHGRTAADQPMDEVSVDGVTEVWDWTGGEVVERVVYPWAYEVDAAPLEELRGGGPAENAAITRGVLDGTIRDGRRRMVVLNAAAGFVVAGVAADMGQGVSLAREVLDSGRGLDKLEALVKATRHAVG